MFSPATCMMFCLNPRHCFWRKGCRGRSKWNGEKIKKNKNTMQLLGVPSTSQAL